MKRLTIILRRRSRLPHIDIPDPVVVKDLASALGQKPFRIIAELMEVGQFANVNGTVGFESASKVAWKHGSSGFSFEALWVGESASEERRVTIDELARLVEKSKLGTKTRYLVE